MHQHIDTAGTFARMKPYQLIQGLMAKQGIAGPMPLAKAANVPTKQPQIHRWLGGEVAEPKRATVEPLAKFFSLPIEAFYDEREATRIARERDIPDPPPKVEKKSRRGRGRELDDETQQLVDRLLALKPQERRKLTQILQDLTGSALDVGAAIAVAQDHLAGGKTKRDLHNEVVGLIQTERLRAAAKPTDDEVRSDPEPKSSPRAGPRKQTAPTPAGT